MDHDWLPEPIAKPPGAPRPRRWLWPLPRSIGQLMTVVALSALAFSALSPSRAIPPGLGPLRRRPTPMPRVVPLPIRVAPLQGQDGAAFDDRILHPSPAGIDDRFLVAAPQGIDDRMIHGPGRPPVPAFVPVSVPVPVPVVPGQGPRQPSPAVPGWEPGLP